ncbi:MAG TPA: DUF4340 domain-containing protein [Candidatus Latescibacteria bacterium]|nr:DUF4340 domain-containing protein [Candidatus Latescibacterota bacterium]
MTLKSVLQICIVFAILAGAILYSNQKEQEKEDVAELTKELVVLDKSRVDGLTIETAAGAVVLRKVDGTWKILEPLQLDASAGAIEGVLANLERAHLKKFLLLDEGEETERLTEYGLIPPHVRVIVQVEGSVLDTIDYGNSPLNTYVYVKRASQQRVGMTELYRRTGVDKDLFELREKRALRFEKSAVTSVRITRPSLTIEIARDGDSWRLQQPSEGPADGGQVDSVLSRLSAAFMTSFDDAPASLSSYGLDTPTLQVDVHAQGADGSTSTHTLSVGDVAASGHYAKSESAPYVFTLDSSFVQGMPTSDFRLGPKKLLDFQRKTVDRVEFIYPDRSILCVRDNNAWVAASPPGPIDGNEMEAILFTMEQLEAVAFTEGSQSLRTPSLRVRAWAASEIVADLSLGQVEGDRVHARGSLIERGTLVEKAEADRLMPERIFVGE